MDKTTILKLSATVCALMCVVALQASCFNIERQEQPEDQALNARAKLLANLQPVSGALTRFLLNGARPILGDIGYSSRQHANNPAYLGFKRSSSNLDPLTGITFAGKRASLDPLTGVGFGKRAYMNLEPQFGRLYAMRSGPIRSDIRWAPMDAYDALVASSN